MWPGEGRSPSALGRAQGRRPQRAGTQRSRGWGPDGFAGGAGGAAPREILTAALRNVAAVVVLLAAAALALLWLAQRRLLYFPARATPEAAERRARAMGLLPWRAGGALLGWRQARPPEGAAAVLLVLHGNAGSALDRGYVLEAFAAAGPPLEVRLVEYPGYGPCPGAPGERALVDTALRAVQAARAEGARRVLLLGESLGGAVAVLAAAQAPGAVDGLVLVAPLASVPAVARRHYGPVPGWFFRDRLRADLAIARVGAPVAVLEPGADEVVFPDLIQALYEAAPGPKRLWVEPGATHNGLDWRPGQGRWREMIQQALGEPGLLPLPQPGP
ncbi:MAG: alpha/beta fold hydrolase [Anaeromyxobacter sp.]